MPASAAGEFSATRRTWNATLPDEDEGEAAPEWPDWG